MEKTQILNKIKQVASQVLPKGSSLYLYGSRARGEDHENSDWDLLLLLDKAEVGKDDFTKYSYTIMIAGFDLWQLFSIQTYTKSQWQNGPHSMYYYNVEEDKQLLYES